MRLIDADELTKEPWFVEFYGETIDDIAGQIIEACKHIVKSAPHIDIVRCKECRWAYPRTLPGETGYSCVFYNVLKAHNGYCDNGERK